MRALDHPTPSVTPRKGFLLALISLSLIVAACAAAPGPTATRSPTTSAIPSATPANPSVAPTSRQEFPLDVTDDNGTLVTIAAEPQSIVSLTPANTEIVYALG